LDCLRGNQESEVAGVAEYASKVFIRKIQDQHLSEKIFTKLSDSLTPELLQLLTPEFSLFIHVCSR
jgi:hypothetical protein